MIITKLGGGLGNQMFQYACGRALAIRNKDDLLLDISIFSKDTSNKHYRAFGLSHFNISARSATDEEIKRVAYPYNKTIKKIWNRFERHILKHHHIKFEHSVLKKQGDVYLDGYWQSEKYFRDARNVLIKELSLKAPFSSYAKEIADRIRSSKNSVSLHVRRGDYVESAANIKIYGTHCNQEYYEKALALIAQKTKNRGELNVFVFSDDVEWVKQNIRIPHNTTYVSETSAPDYERMVLMSLCQSHIIANSTFGWWPAWLDNKPDKIVIAPSIWIPGIDLPIDDIIPPEWIRI